MWTSGDGSHAPRGPEVRAELTPVVPVSLRVRSGTRGSVFEPVEAPLTALHVPGHYSREVCIDEASSMRAGINLSERMSGGVF